MTREHQRNVLVLNHFAVPRTCAGGTRHVELFDRLEGWRYDLIAANRNLFDRKRYRPDSSVITVPTIGYQTNGIMRVLNWLSFAVGASLRGLVTPRPDVVYASSPHLLTGLAGWFLAKIRRAKFVLEVRDLWPEVLVAMGRLDQSSVLVRALSRLERWLYREADLIVVLAKGSQEAIAAHGISREKLFLLPNGADPSDFTPPAHRDDLRQRFGLNGVVFVYAGAHGPANGLHLLLDACEEVQNSELEVTLLLVGDGLSKPGLVADAERRHLTKLRFTDPIPKEDMPALLGAADVGLHVLADVPLFRYSVSPNKMFDYMAAGLPVLSNVPGVVSDCLVEAGAGVATAPDDIARGIAEMARASKQQRREWGEAGRRHIARHHSRAKLAADLENLLDSLNAEES